MMRNNFYPKVTIVIPVYNGSNYLASAIESALNQTYDNVEVIVVNDGSDDFGATEAIALSYGCRIQYVFQKNGGVSSALNSGIRRMKGEYFSWLSHDDIYFPEKIERQINTLAQLPVERREKTIVYTDYLRFEVNTGKSEIVTMPLLGKNDFYFWLLTENKMHGCSLIVPRLAFDSVGLFDVELRTTQDYEMWFRMVKIFDFLLLREVLIKSRTHSEQGSITMRPLAILEQDALLVNGILNLTTSDLKASTKKTAVFAYAALASRMWCNRFDRAAKEAIRLSIMHISKTRPAEMVGLFVIILIYYLKHRVYIRLIEKVKGSLKNFL